MERILLSTLLIGLFISIASYTNAQDAIRMYRIAKIKVDAGQLEKYKSALQEQMKTAINIEPGVLSYTVVADKNDATVFTILEVYASAAAYQLHISTPHFKKYKESVKEMVLSLELLDTELVARIQKSDY
jgi:quinol monooxygenase YgiN